MRTGIASLPLHYGKTPRWLFERMCKLGQSIVDILIYEYSKKEFIKRLSSPFWFQSFSCVLGFDWHSSGTTTVTCGVLKQILNKDMGIILVGGKGKISRNVPEEINKYTEVFNLEPEKYKYISRMTAKIDNCAIQDGYDLYHHTFLITEDGDWAVIQQGMSPEQQLARRYHWFSGAVKDMVIEPHTAILCDRKEYNVLDMTSKQSHETRKICVDIAKDGDKKLYNILNLLHSQTTIEQYSGEKNLKNIDKKIEILTMPKKINWNVVKAMYEFQPKNYEELLSIKGIGKNTVRALALISDLIYGEKPSWNDPVKYSFAVGGKDGVPYPVDRTTMDETIQMLKEGIENAKISEIEKLNAIKRLRNVVGEM